MTMLATKEVLSLKPLDKIQLIDELLLSLDMPNKELDEIWAEESEKRIDAYEEGRTQSHDIYEVLAKYTR
ncbi:addiction module protein [Aliarcobacter cryaerophilus]|uniref:addiction module protein n=1 Tax=Aliarcobacter cryaerophilus TaxID=28198 RepID=UPI003DA3DD3A